MPSPWSPPSGGADHSADGSLKGVLLPPELADAYADAAAGAFHAYADAAAGALHAQPSARSVEADAEAAALRVDARVMMEEAEEDGCVMEEEEEDDDGFGGQAVATDLDLATAWAMTAAADAAEAAADTAEAAAEAAEAAAEEAIATAMAATEAMTPEATSHVWERARRLTDSQDEGLGSGIDSPTPVVPESGIASDATARADADAMAEDEATSTVDASAAARLQATTHGRQQRAPPDKQEHAAERIQSHYRGKFARSQPRTSRSRDAVDGADRVGAAAEEQPAPPTTRRAEEGQLTEEHATSVAPDPQWSLGVSLGELAAGAVDPPSKPAAPEAANPEAEETEEAPSAPATPDATYPPARTTQAVTFYDPYSAAAVSEALKQQRAKAAAEAAAEALELNKLVVARNARKSLEKEEAVRQKAEALQKEVQDINRSIAITRRAAAAMRSRELKRGFQSWKAFL